MTLSQEELKEIETKLVSLAVEKIGPLIKSGSGTIAKSYDNKANLVDLVTVVDKRIELIIYESLKKLYPNFKFIGEESYQKDITTVTDAPTFIIDPIDGTTNFIHGYPFSCTSMGLCEKGEPVVGVVFNPHLDLLFHGSKGNGAFLNNNPIEIKRNPLILQQSLVALESGSERDNLNFKAKMNTYSNLLDVNGGFIHGTRSAGSAAMNLCYVAMGVLDSYWEGGCWAWDVCAGWCILKEVGGVVVGGNPNVWEVPINGRVYLAVRGGASTQEQNRYISDFWSHVDGKLVYN